MTAEVILQHSVRPGDTEWCYQGEHIPRSYPPSKIKNMKGCQVIIRSVNVSSEKITLSQLQIPENRLMMADGTVEKLIHVSFHKLNFIGTNRKKDWRKTAEYIVRFLKTGLVLHNTRFKFYGHSNSQLRARSCYLRAEDYQLSNFDKINKFGMFPHKEYDVSKRARTIAHLFTPAVEVRLTLDSKKSKNIKDKIEGDLNFTDGCGFINNTFAREISEEINPNKSYIEPSVFQIRYLGCKGILMVTPDEEFEKIVKDNTRWYQNAKQLLSRIWGNEQTKPLILYRDSMEKFYNCSDKTNFLVINHSKPFCFGRLNSEIITLLSTLGIPDEVFINRMKNYLNLIKNSTENIEKAIEFSILKYRFDCTKDLKNFRNIYDVPAVVMEKLRKLQKDERDSFVDEGKLKVRIPVKNSRYLFGVCDISEKLREGECFVQYTDLTNWSGRGKTTIKSLSQKIIVTRNPCLHPGDIQYFKAVGKIKELEHLTDCIVFSVKGKKPAASLLSGGDLDGDKFFVCWDHELLPSKTDAPADYSKFKPEMREKAEILQEDMIQHFANYNSSTLGRTKNTYLKWVHGSLLRARSPQCFELNGLFSKCVDGGTIKIPPHLADTPEPTREPFVLKKLENMIDPMFKDVEDTDDEDLLPQTALINSNQSSSWKFNDYLQLSKYFIIVLAIVFIALVLLGACTSVEGNLVLAIVFTALVMVAFLWFKRNCRSRLKEQKLNIA